MLDPVRFLSNLSTGEMGYALARAARRRKYEVTLISGPTALKPPQGVRFIPIVSSQELKQACQKYFPKSDVLIMSAAVCDFTASSKSSQKIMRTKTAKLSLKQTPDILKGLAAKKGTRKVIGFCLETSNWLGNAKKKIQRKNLDGIVANYYNAKHIPFGNRKINTAFVDSSNQVEHLKQLTKPEISRRLLDWLETL